MTDNKDDKLTLRTNDQKQKVVRQNVTTGQSKNVAVEIKRRKPFRPSGPNQQQHPTRSSQTLTSEEMQTRIDAVKKSQEQQRRMPPKFPSAPAAQVERPAVVSPEEEDKARKAAAALKEREKRNKKFEEPVVAVKPEKKKNDFEKRRATKKIAVQTVEVIDESEEGDLPQERVRFNRRRKKFKQAVVQQPQAFVKREVIIPDTLTVAELANRMAVRAGDVVKELIKQGMIVTINQSIEADIAELLVTEFGHTPKRVSEDDFERGIQKTEDQPDDLITRAPVVTIMGHVDHGKTSLLDRIRKADVAASEAGGITQHIGAYKVTAKSGKQIVFIDTPGHAAFSSMRARGANITDVVVLVVAGDDSVKEQTIEALHHAKAAKVPIIVAVNKMDKPGASIDRVNNDLLQQELVPESMGGDIQVIGVSAKTGMGIDELEDAILLQAEILELKANPNKAAEGTVLEASMEKGRGITATVLVQSGTLRIGDIMLAGHYFGRVKAMIDDKGQVLKEASVSTPVSVLGLNGMPKAGDDVVVLSDEQTASSIAAKRMERDKRLREAAFKRGTLANLLDSSVPGQTLSIIVKADTHGSSEAIKQSLEKLSTEKVNVRVLHEGVGAITENDISLAKASRAVIIGFNVRASGQARDQAKEEGIEIQYHSIIYNIIDEVKKAIGGLLGPIIRDKFIGHAEVRKVFHVSKVGNVAGCMVTDGIVQRGAKIRLLRDDVVVHEGSVKSLKRFKDEVKEVKEGYECGIAFENYNDIKVGDIIECSIEEVIQQEY